MSHTNRYERVFRLFPSYVVEFPHTRMAELLQARYGTWELESLSDEQLAHFGDHLEETTKEACAVVA